MGDSFIAIINNWSQVLSLKRASNKVFSDERILGTSEFVQNIILEADDRSKETLILSAKLPDLPVFAKQICKREQIEESELCSGLRKRRVVKARKLFAR